MIALGSAARWLGLALLGLAIAAAVAFAASRLVSQRIGLASERLNAGRELAPPAAHEAKQKPGRDHGSGQSGKSTSPTPTSTATQPAAPTTTTGTIPTAPPSGGSSSGESGADD